MGDSYVISTTTTSDDSSKNNNSSDFNTQPWKVIVDSSGDKISYDDYSDKTHIKGDKKGTVRIIFSVHPSIDNVHDVTLIIDLEEEQFEVKMSPPIKNTFLWTTCTRLTSGVSIFYHYKFHCKGEEFLSGEKTLIPTGFSCHVQERLPLREKKDHIWSTHGFVGDNTINQKSQLHLLFGINNKEPIQWYKRKKEEKEEKEEEEYTWEIESLKLSSANNPKETIKLQWTPMDRSKKQFLKCCFLSSALPKTTIQSSSSSKDDLSINNKEIQSDIDIWSHFTTPKELLLIHVDFYGRKIKNNKNNIENNNHINDKKEKKKEEEEEEEEEEEKKKEEEEEEGSKRKIKRENENDKDIVEDDMEYIGRGFITNNSISLGSGPLNIHIISCIPQKKIKKRDGEEEKDNDKDKDKYKEKEIKYIKPKNVLIGTCRVYFMLITPFAHALPSGDSWKSHNKFSMMSQTEYMGHRGSGANRALSSPHKVTGKMMKRTSTFENTLLSFEKAATKGRQWVEFDVQLTSDSIPIVYHDHAIPLDVDLKYSVPIHNLTYAQFRSLSRKITFGEISKRKLNRNRSEEDMRQLSMRHAEHKEHSKKFQYKSKGSDFKVSIHGKHIQIKNEFPSLKQLFRSLPPTLGFDVELKYKKPTEANSHLLAEKNFFLNTILGVIFDNYNEQRNIIFSSFDADICMALVHKQNQYPVFFLYSRSDNCTTCDSRVDTFENTAHFVKSYGMMGIIVDSNDILQTGAEIIKTYKHDSCLLLGSYGMANNDPDLVKKQIQMGVDFIITDHMHG